MKVKNTTEILTRLRERMKYRSLLAYIIPTEDEHLGEYSTRQETRRSFISGFTGSRGVAIVTQTKAALWTDGRYYLQAAKEIDTNWILMKDGLIETPSQTDWLRKELPEGGQVGADPFLVSASQWKTLRSRFSNFSLDLVRVIGNLVDEIWSAKPCPGFSPISVHPLCYAGLTWVEKVRKVQTMLKDKGATTLVITQLDDIAWLLNLRGDDIQYHPLFYSYAIVDRSDVHLFIHEGRLDAKVLDHLTPNDQSNELNIKVHQHHYSNVCDFLTNLCTEKNTKVWISQSSSEALVSIVPKAMLLSLPCPIAEMKAKKNSVEVAAMRRAHVKDAVSLCEFFHWLEHTVPMGTVTEVSAAEKLLYYKTLQDDFMGPSFEFISSVGANASVIHYAPSPETDVYLNTKEVYLTDTGGQYRDGTTDVTRVLHFGCPSPFERDCFTRVLKGHIAISNAIFPENTKGSKLDVLARFSLWSVGLDYAHGTGHGVGQFLCVHEGPYGIRGIGAADEELPLAENMIISNEPGYYADGAFGLRLESLVQVVKAQTEHQFKGKQFYTFDEVTLVPIQLKLINKDMMTAVEIKWLNDYHSRVRDVIGQELKSQGKSDVFDWLTEQTVPL